MLNERELLSYQKLCGEHQREGIPTENSASTLVDRFLSDQVAVCYICGEPGLGANLQSLADLLRNSHATLIFMIYNEQSYCEKFEAQDLVGALDSRIALRKLMDADGPGSTVTADATATYKQHYSPDLRSLIGRIEQHARSHLLTIQAKSVALAADSHPKDAPFSQFLSQQ